MAVDKTWLVLIAGVGILAFALWSGINTMTVKMTLLWTFITFGFLTLVMHVFGSPISIVLSKLFQSAENTRKTPVYTHNELRERRNRALQKKQVLQDDKVKVYKENVLRPRVEALKEKQEAEFYKFSTVWKGKGNRLGHHSDELFEDNVEEDFLDQEFLLNGSTSSEEESETEEELNNTESTDKPAFSMQQQDNEMHTLRQRINKQCVKLTEEPPATEKGVVTVALRCPDGTVKKRRFTAESQIQALVTFAEYLGYAPSRYVILTTYPRKPLSDTSQTFSDAGLTHDTALVIEETPE